MAFLTLAGKLLKKVRRCFTLPHPVRRCFFSPFLRRFQVVVDLPLGFDEFMAGLAQEVGRMEGRHDGYPMVVDPVSARTDDARVSSQKETEGDFAKADDDLRLYLPDFFSKPYGSAEMAFLDRRRAVAARAALHDIRHIDMVARDADGGESFVEELSRRTNQGPP